MAATVAAPLERRLGEIAGVTELTSTSSLGTIAHHGAVRPHAQHRGRRARRAGGAQRRAQRPARRPADAADLPQSQSRGGADADPGADLEDAAAERDLRRRRQRHRAAHLAGRRRRRRHRRRRRAAGDPRAGRSDAARCHGPVAWRTCARRSPTPMRSARSAPSTATQRAATIGINDQLRDAGRLRPAGGEDRERHGHPAVQRRDRSARACATAAPPAGSTAILRCC